MANSTPSNTGFLSKTFDCSEKAVFVTGCSSGLGQQFALAFAQAGCRTIALAARRKEKLEAFATKLRNDFPGMNCVAVACDVSQKGQVSTAFDVAEEKAGAIFDVIVNNAGVASPKFFLDSTEEDYNYTMDINVKGVWLVTLEAAKRLAKHNKPGSIINISSILGLRVQKLNSIYSISKAAVLQMTKALSLELIRYNIRVNAICPGYYESEMSSDFLNSPTGKRFIKAVPTQRIGKAHELNGMLLLLGSDASSNMTGTCTPVDGGHVISSL